MNIEELAYLSLFDTCSTNSKFDTALWLKARDLLRKRDTELLKKREELLTDSFLMIRARKKYL
jgi:hypothetical protein